MAQPAGRLIRPRQGMAGRATASAAAVWPLAMFDREMLRDGLSTRQHAIFEPGAATVIFDAGAPPVIGEGDRLAVAGRKLLGGG